MSTSTDTAARAALTRLLGRRTTFPTRGCALAIADRRAFRAGNVYGHPTPHLAKASMREVRSMAQAPGSWMPDHVADRFVSDRPVYVVWSFMTPIGWITSNGRAVVPEVSYSSRTTRHQAEAARGLEGAVVPDAFSVDAAGEPIPTFGHGTQVAARRNGWTWIDGELLHPDELVTVTARPFRSRRTAERSVIATVPASEFYDLRSAASGYGEHPAISGRWSDVSGERAGV